MKIERITALYWSATGNTRQATVALGQALAEQLSVPFRTVNFTLPQVRRRIHAFLPDEFVVVGAPTYAGKLPNKILPDFTSKLVGKQTPCAAVVTYGNRSFDNSLAELWAVLQKNGMNPMGAAAVPCRHAFTDALAAGRPDEEDLATIRDFAKKIVAHTVLDMAVSVRIPGQADAPYYVPRGMDGQPAKFLKAKPKTDMSRCDACGICADICPMGAIDKNDVAAVPGICIKCQACVRSCPKQAKYFDDPAFLSHVDMLKQHFADSITGRKKISFYI
ncbi:MAG: EFR1 family ferrodoxin [Megasphaera sp.]|jgi:ferredoxin/flavodoxin|nr:EFR1 family ferrodoxin [Megasphaera sp.]MCI1247833.1 EFR1 family ferrodoxin [Megasphaera sp.]